MWKYSIHTEKCISLKYTANIWALRRVMCFRCCGWPWPVDFCFGFCFGCHFGSWSVSFFRLFLFCFMTELQHWRPLLYILNLEKQHLKANLEFVVSGFWIKPRKKNLMRGVHTIFFLSIRKPPEVWARECWAHAKDVGGLHVFCFFN